MRLTPRGELDAGFAEAGLLRVPALEPGRPGPPVPADVTVDAQGRILVALRGLGRTELRRYTSDGRTDESFGVQGVVVPAMPVGRVAAAPDGGLVVPTAAGSDVLAVARLRPDGTRDPGFGAEGIATIALPAGAPEIASRSIGAVEVDRHGRVAVAVSWRPPGGPSSVAIVRLGADGRPDASFGDAGVASISRNPSEIALQPGGAIAYTFPGGRAGLPFRIGLGRLTAEGEPDDGLGAQGIRLFDGGPTTNFQPHLLSTSDGGWWPWPATSSCCSTGGRARWPGSAEAVRRGYPAAARTECRSSTTAGGSSCTAATWDPRRPLSAVSRPPWTASRCACCGLRSRSRRRAVERASP